MTQTIYEVTITPAAEDEPVVVSIPANDAAHAKELIEAQFGPVKHWWSAPTPKKLVDQGASHSWRHGHQKIGPGGNLGW
jgi:hypothetical protein